MYSRLHSRVHVMWIQSELKGCSVIILDIKGRVVNPKLSSVYLCCCAHSFYPVSSLWSHAFCSPRGGSLCPGTAPLFSLIPMGTSTSNTPLLKMQVSTSALPPVLWATPAGRSSSASTVRQRDSAFSTNHPVFYVTNSVTCDYR